MRAKRHSRWRGFAQAAAFGDAAVAAMSITGRCGNLLFSFALGIAQPLAYLVAAIASIFVICSFFREMKRETEENCLEMKEEENETGTEI